MPNADIKLPRGSILNAVSQVCPRKTDWTQVYACKLFKDENSDEYLSRLREMFVSKQSLHLFQSLFKAWVLKFLEIFIT